MKNTTEESFFNDWVNDHYKRSGCYLGKRQKEYARWAHFSSWQECCRYMLRMLDYKEFDSREDFRDFMRSTYLPDGWDKEQ